MPLTTINLKFLIEEFETEEVWYTCSKSEPARAEKILRVGCWYIFQHHFTEFESLCYSSLIMSQVQIGKM